MKSLRWHQPLPRWARIVCVLFGLANVGGAMVQFSEMTIPGITVGAIWALFGWKGLPLISSSSGDAAQQDAGLRTIRRRRIVALAVPIAWLPFAAMLLPRVHRQFLPTVFFLSAIPVFFLVFRCFFSACPRCHRHFFINDSLFRTSLHRCMHCALSLKTGADTASIRRQREP